MGILDEAIREHMELKRQHGAGDSELQKIEDEAFGPAERPGGEAPDPLAEAPTEFLATPEEGEEEASPKPAARHEGPSIADLQEPPEPPGEPEPAGHSTEEREAIAAQPTEMFDVEEELTGAPAPTDEELIEEEIAEPRLGPSDPLASLEGGDDAPLDVAGPGLEEEEDEEFWSEQRLSDELDQALESPLDDEEDLDDEESPVAEGEEEGAQETEPSGQHEERHSEDLLDETPDFLEEAPEDDQLWFEQKPPKDFDLDD